MTANHTKAPWIVQIDEDRNDSSFTTIKVVDGSRESLTHPQGALTLANIQTFAPHLKEGIANAHLIASAPDLLDALDLLLNKINAHGLENKHMFIAIEKAEMAIAKAKGKV
jgi:hypothetical protein